jgi:hypothetical protein
MKTLIKISNKEVQELIFKIYNVKVYVGMVFCTQEKITNSSLWFEMWQPDKEYL